MDISRLNLPNTTLLLANDCLRAAAPHAEHITKVAELTYNIQRAVIYLGHRDGAAINWPSLTLGIQT